MQGQGLERELTTLVRLPCWEGKGGIYAAVNDGRETQRPLPRSRTGAGPGKGRVFSVDEGMEMSEPYSDRSDERTKPMLLVEEDGIYVAS